MKVTDVDLSIWVWSSSLNSLGGRHYKLYATDEVFSELNLYCKYLRK